MTEWTVEVYNTDSGERMYVEMFSDREQACDKYTELVDVYGNELDYDVYISEDGDLIETTAIDDDDYEQGDTWLDGVIMSESWAGYDSYEHAMYHGFALDALA